MKNILVFYGGQSPEHDVSVITGVMTVNASGAKYRAVPVYVSREGLWYTGRQLTDIGWYSKPAPNKLKRVCLTPGDNALYYIKGKKLKKGEAVSCAVNCMHGAKGEDGALKGLLDMSGIPLVGSPLLPAALSMDKCATKIFLKGLNIKTLPYEIFRDGDDLDKIEKNLGYPIMVKPSSLGSSIGVNKAADRAELVRSINKAKKFDDKILLEKCASDKIEINAAAYRGERGVVVSECEMPATENKFLTFEDKYIGGNREFPAPIPKKLSDKIRGITEKIYKELGFSGVIRVDFLLENGVPYVNEINSVPGSMAYYLFTDTFHGFAEIIGDMVETAMKEFNARATLISKFDCDILKITGGKGGKRFDKSRGIM